MVLGAACSGDATPPPAPSRAPVTNAAPPAEPEPAAATVVPPVAKPQGAHDFGPLLGGRRVTHRPVAGDYAGGLVASQSRFITTEIKVGRSIAGGTALQLGTDGTVRGCIWSKTIEHSSRSKYVSDDGKHHVDDNESALQLGVEGSWKAEGDAVAITLTRLDHRSCARTDARDALTPVALHCVALDVGDGMPVAGIACRVDTPLDRAQAVAMLLAESPRAGAWALREDLEQRGNPLQLAADARPWLLMGAAPGLRVDHDDPRGGDAPRVTFEAAPVIAPPAPAK